MVRYIRGERYRKEGRKGREAGGQVSQGYGMGMNRVNLCGLENRLKQVVTAGSFGSNLGFVQELVPTSLPLVRVLVNGIIENTEWVADFEFIVVVEGPNRIVEHDTEGEGDVRVGWSDAYDGICESVGGRVGVDCGSRGGCNWSIAEKYSVHVFDGNSQVSVIVGLC